MLESPDWVVFEKNWAKNESAYSFIVYQVNKLQSTGITLSVRHVCVMTHNQIIRSKELSSQLIIITIIKY